MKHILIRLAFVLCAITIALLLRSQIQIKNISNENLFTCLALFLSFVGDSLFKYFEKNAEFKQERFNKDYSTQIEREIQSIKNDIFPSMINNISMTQPGDELKTLLDEQFRLINVKMNSIANTICCMEANFKKSFTINIKKANNYLTRTLDEHWSEKYQELNPRKVSDFISLINETLSNHNTLIQAAAVNNTNECREKFNNFRSEILILFDNLENLLYYLSIKYKKI